MTALERLLAANFIERLGWTLVHSLWQLAALAVIAGLLLWAARRGSPQVRYVIACAAMLGMMVFPVVTYCTLDSGTIPSVRGGAALLARTPPSSLSQDNGFSGGVRASSGTPASNFSAPAGSRDERGVAAGEPAASQEASLSGSPMRVRDFVTFVRPALPWLAGFWGAGFSLLSVYHLGGWIVLGRLRRRATRLAAGRLDESVARWSRRLGVRRGVGLLESAVVRVPTVMGWLRPVILMPAGLLSGLSPAEVEAVLVHELVHVRRYDYLVNLLQTVAESLLFYHPAAWWISHRIRVEREYCVDAAAAVAAGDRLAYAKALTTLEEQCGRLHHLAMAATGGRLRQRIQYLLCGPAADGPRHGTLLAGTFLSLILVAAMVLLPTARGGGSVIAPEPSRDREGAANASPETPDSEGPSQGKPLPDGRGSDAKSRGSDAKSRGSVSVVLHVAADGSQPYKSIQKAIDAAPDGAVIKIAAGTYDEQLTIAKPLTLEGAGWDKTLVRSTDNGKEWFSEQWISELQQRIRAATSKAMSDDDRRRVEEDLYRKIQASRAALIRDTRGVEIRGVRFSQPGGRTLAGMEFVPAVEFRGAAARLVDSAVVGSFGEGIRVGDGSDVEIRHCLVVAAARGTGIEIRGDQALQARVFDCDIRQCVYAGITIRGQSAKAEVARCRISGASWHGIRYDDCSPQIHDNLIFDNARCGIYASGKTAAVVRGNLFYRNTMDGMSCWFDNRDTIEGNTFAENQREGLMIIDRSKPRVRRNIFFANGNAIEWGFSEKTDAVTAIEPRHIEGNLFWRNKALAVRPNPEVARQMKQLQEEVKELERHPGQSPQAELNRISATFAELQKKRLEKVPLDPQWGNTEANPQFVDRQKQNFSLAANSPAHKDRIGAADPIPFASPWPTQAEEKALLPSARRAEAPRLRPGVGDPGATRRVPYGAIVRDVLQRKDPAVRRQGLEKLQAMLAPKASVEEQHAGLLALGQVMTAKFDRGMFRPLVLQFLKSDQEDLRRLALYVLPNLGATADDLELVIPMVDDPSPGVSTAAGRALIFIDQGKHQEQVIPALMKVLRDPDSKVVTEVIRSMWGQYSSPEFDELLIKLSRDRQYHHIVVYHALSTMRRKSVAVCRRLVEVLDEPDWNDSGRAAWGLTYGVVDEAKPIVEGGLLAALPEETNDYTWGQEFRALKNVATEKSRAYLQSVIDNELETDDHKSMAREILKGLEQKR